MIDSATNVNFISLTERQVIDEINMARTDPMTYARVNLEPLRSYFYGKLLQYPGEVAIITVEGVAALDECIRELMVAMPVPALSPKEGLSRAARDQAIDQARTGATGHASNDGSTSEARISRYGQWLIAQGENISYGHSEARRIVTALLIDDGVTSRGHRSNLLDSKYTFIGVAVGPHPYYGHMCVIDFAGGYD